MNELHLETSPYLLQHANNPVHWKAWNNASLAVAKEKNQLIIISIGYSACHWCHVMEHESFENESVAAVMNAHFVNIKVDREERPDVDAVYMKAVQIMTGHGGWPLNIVALPDGRPVWGGTYFRIEEWTDTLEQLQKMYQLAPEKMIDYGMGQKAIIPYGSDKYKEMIDKEIDDIILEAYYNTKSLLQKIEPLLQECSDLLVKEHVLKEEDIQNKIKNKYYYLM